MGGPGYAGPGSKASTRDPFRVSVLTRCDACCTRGWCRVRPSPCFGDTIQLAVDVAEIDTASINYLPVALRTRHQAKGLYLTLPLAVLRRDSDGDGFTDLAAHHLLLDRARTDGGTPFLVGSDAASLTCRAPLSSERLALAALLGRIFDPSGAALVEPVDRQPPTVGFGWRDRDTHRAALLHRCGNGGCGTSSHGRGDGDIRALVRSRDRLGTLGRRNPALEHEGGRAGARPICGGGSGLSALSDALAAAQVRGVPINKLGAATGARLDDAVRYRVAYNRYVAPFAGIDDLRIAPFHLLAGESAVHDDKDHLWHMAAAHRLAAADPALLLATAYRRIDVDDPAQVADAIAWWEMLIEADGGGMVVKPLDFLSRGTVGVLQPAIKRRGREYLRIIYGPHYDRPDNLIRLKRRGLGQKRSMALREFALGFAALHRFVEHAALTRVHQCVFGVLAMESEPVAPRCNSPVRRQNRTEFIICGT